MSLLLAYYGDDFTGSTDVMEVLQWAGLRTVLFLDIPTRRQLDAFDNLCAFGMAGWSRTMSPAEMDEELRPAMGALKESGAPIVHYKTCSTFDSAPDIGSIGKAMDIGRDLFGRQPVPLLIGAPALGRYVVFGNLFARSGLDSPPHRLDRHPSMRYHPITPMSEADLRAHLARQTKLDVRLLNVLDLDNGDPVRAFELLLAGAPDAVLFDTLFPHHVTTLGHLIDRLSRQIRPLFAVGSSGLEYALTAWWEATGFLAQHQSHPALRPPITPVNQLLVLTGSCSPVNDRQIAHALDHGFVELPLDTPRLINPATTERETDSAVRRALELASNGASLILHSSRGPDDPRIAATLNEYAALGFSELDIKLKNGRTLGPILGRILRRVMDARPLQRAAVAGGDTSTYAARELGIEALEAVAPVAPGSPLCRVSASNNLHGLEILFKGGQVGGPDLWTLLLKGNAGVGTPPSDPAAPSPETIIQSSSSP